MMIQRLLHFFLASVITLSRLGITVIQELLVQRRMVDICAPAPYFFKGVPYSYSTLWLEIELSVFSS